MDDTFLGLWNGWSFLAMVLLAFTMAENGNISSRKGQSQWQPALMFIAGVFVTMIYMHSGLLTLTVSIPVTLLLTMVISVLLVPQWNAGRDAMRDRAMNERGPGNGASTDPGLRAGSP